jgi:hypothetical protein
MKKFDQRRTILRSLYALPLLGFKATWAGQQAKEMCIRLETGKNVAHFNLPARYGATVDASFFRIVVDYRTLAPTVTEPGTPEWESALDIYVYPFPPGRTPADMLFADAPNIRPAGNDQGCRIFNMRVSSDVDDTLYLCDDNRGAYFVFSRLASGQRDRLERGFENEFSYKCSFSKHLASHFRDIESNVTHLLRSFYTTENCQS